MNPNTEALDEAQAHLERCTAHLEALDLALAAYRNEEALRYVREIDATTVSTTVGTLGAPAPANRK